MEIIQKIYESDGLATFRNYRFSYRTDCNTGGPEILPITGGEEVLFYHDNYIDGVIQYSRSYRYIRFSKDMKTNDEIRTTCCEQINDEDLKNILLTGRPFERTLPFTTNEYSVIEKIGDVNRRNERDVAMMEKYFKMYDEGELPEDWDGIIYLTDRKDTQRGHLYKIRNTSIDYSYE